MTGKASVLELCRVPLAAAIVTSASERSVEERSNHTPVLSLLKGLSASHRVALQETQSAIRKGAAGHPGEPPKLYVSVRGSVNTVTLNQLPH